MKLRIALAGAMVLCTAACSKPSGTTEKQAEPGANATAAATAAATATQAAKPAGPKVIAVAKLGLKGTAPGETEDPIIGDGDPVMIMGATFSVNLEVAKATDPKKASDAQKDAKLFNGKDVQTQTLSDGWVVTFENTGSMGTNYWVTVRRDIAGKAYLCTTTQDTAEKQKAAVAFCESLTAQ